MRKFIVYESVETDFFEDINMSEPLDVGVKEDDIFVLITHSYSKSFEYIVYNKKLDVLVKLLKKYKDILDQDVEKRKEIEYLHSSIGEMIGFRGYWTSKDSEKMYHEAIIVRAKSYNGSLGQIDETI